jgi:hypothetical protein
MQSAAAPRPTAKVGGGPMRYVLASVLLVACACAGPAMKFREVVTPNSSPFTVSASIDAYRANIYAATVTIRNGSPEALPLNWTTFEITAPPATFVPLYTLKWGRSGFRMPPLVSPGGVAHGQVYFQMQPGETKPRTGILHVHLPNGDHQVFFDFD